MIIPARAGIITDGSDEGGYISSGFGCRPEDNPFKHIFVDVTFRCNMRCRNCYMRPYNGRPDPDAEWLLDIFRRLPRRTNIRLIGGEPTIRADLPELVRRIRAMGHTPVLLTNGLKLADSDYLLSLKRGGLRTVHLSCNGGMSDDLYERIDRRRCARYKMLALDNLCREHFRVSVGMILVSGINVPHLREFYGHLANLRQVCEIKLRSVGRYGSFVAASSPTMGDMKEICATELGIGRETIERGTVSPSLCSFHWDDKRFQLTEWPDLNNGDRGYLMPDGTVEPFFEYLAANAQTGS